MYNYHTHTSWCDGRQDAEDVILKAIELNYKALGFSGHAPSSLAANWQMTIQGYENYKKQILELKDKYSDKIQIYLGLEADYIPGIVSPNNFKNDNLDYIIGSVHYVKSPLIEDRFLTIDSSSELFQKALSNYFNNDIKLVVTEYYKSIREMVVNHTPTIIGHIDIVKKFNKNKQFFSEKQKWYIDELDKTLDVISNSKAIVEVNTRGFYKGLSTEFYPSNYILNLCEEKNIPLMINTDAHHSLELNLGKAEAIVLLKSLNIKSIKILSENIWSDLEL